MEVLVEQAELPQLIRDVFADVGDGAVRADDHLRIIDVCLRRLCFSRLLAVRLALLLSELRGRRLALEQVRRHDPAAAVLALGLEVDGLSLFQ